LFLSAERDEVSSSQSPAKDVFATLDAELEEDYVEISKRWFEFTGGKVGADAENDAMDEDLPAVAGLSLDPTSAASKEKSKSKKPPFYDIAFNYVTAFDLDSIAVQAGLAEAPVVEGSTGGEEEDIEIDEGEEEEREEQSRRRKGGEEEKPATPSRSKWFGLF
jgi:signal recognition particle subunit SRP68